MAAVAALKDLRPPWSGDPARDRDARLGELLDLEPDCLWDFGGRGTWVKVPLGKLGTERTVALDEATLGDFDAWMALRGTQRALTHPGHDQLADFVFVERGRRLSAFRLRHGLDTAIATAGFTGTGGPPYANICEQCDNYVPAPEFQPALQDQLADIHALRDDAPTRNWDSETARHDRVIASIDNHLRRLRNQASPATSS